MRARAFARRLAAALGATTLAALGAGGLVGAAAAPAAPSSAIVPAPLANVMPASAVQEFGACLRGGGEADLLLLVDESGSLSASDPAAARVTSATYFVNQLAASVAGGGQPIELQLGVFAHEASTIMPWERLSDATLPGIRDSIASLADRADGWDTDYWTALDSAQRELAAKVAASPGETRRCQAIVMFTDGQLDYEPRVTAEQQRRYGTEKVFAPGVSLTTQAGADQVAEAARTDICRAGGLADQLVSSGVRLFGIGLSVDPNAQTEFDLFQSIVEGHGPSGSSCGTLNQGDGGDFFHATDIDSLLLAFDAIVDPPIEVVGGICQHEPCSSEAHEFVLDTSTPDVRILAQADVAGLEVSILMPNGALVRFPRTEPGQSAQLTQDGATFTYAWETDKTISISATQQSAAPTAWMGLWQLAFTDPSGQSAGQQSRSNIHITGSLVPDVADADALELHTGGTVDLDLGIADRRTNARVDPGTIPGRIGYSATLVDAAGTSFEVLSTSDTAGLASPASVDLADAAVGDAELRLTLDLTTAPATRPDGSAVPGTTLEPAVVSVPVSILTPADFPTVGGSIDFGSASGDVDLTATLPVSGDGCVWLDGEAPAVVAAPDGIGAIEVTAGDHTSADTCFHAGGAEGIELRLRTESPGNGTINGTVPVMLGSSDGSGDPIRVDVPFTASLERPLNTLNFVLVLIAAPLLGIGVPVLLLYLAKFAISKIPARPLVAAVVPVQVAHGQVLRDGAPFEIGPRDLTGTVAIPPDGGRTLRIGDVTLRARTGASPTGAGYVTVAAPGRASASSAMPSTDASGVTARLPLAVHNTWVVLHTDGAPADQAHVLVLVGGDAAQTARTELRNDIARRLPDVLAALVAASGGAPAGGPVEPATVGSPFRGGAGGPPAPGGAAGSPFQGGPPYQDQGGPPAQGGGGSPWGTT